MADRTYNHIYKKILDEPWDELTILIAEQLLILCPNSEGVFDMPLGAVRRLFRAMLARFGVSRNDVDNAIDESIQELIDAGMIKLYRDNTVIWIKRKWSKDRYSNNKNNQIGAIRAIRNSYPEIVNDFCEMYGLSPDLVGTKFQLSTDEREHTDTDTDSDTESNISLSSDSAESSTSKPRAHKQTSFRTTMDHETQLAKLEERLEKNIAKEWEQFKNMMAMNNSTKRVAHRRLYKTLEEIIWQIETYKLLTPQVIHGFKEAMKANALNARYIRKAALSYEGEDIVTNPAQPQPRPQGIKIIGPEEDD